MSTQVLLLNANYTPHKIIPWEKAIYLLMDKKARTVENYSDKVIRTQHMEIPWPAVIALTKFVKPNTKVRFKRTHVFARDAFICQYCGAKPLTTAGLPNKEALTLDHVVPRAQAVSGKVHLPWNDADVAVTCWENAVTACKHCNNKKADRTPAQAGMPLKGTPHKPSPKESVRMSLPHGDIPAEWHPYIGPG